MNIWQDYESSYQLCSLCNEKIDIMADGFFLSLIFNQYS